MSASEALWWPKVKLARTWAVCGKVGIAGLIICFVTNSVLIVRWQQRNEALAGTGDAAHEGQQEFPFDKGPRPASTSKYALGPVTPQVEFATLSELPAVLRDIEALAMDQSLTWSKAAYSLVEKTGKLPSYVEVSCTLKGSYPSIRWFLARVLESQPGIGLREVTMSRTTSIVREVDVRVTFMIFLRSDGQVPPIEGR